MTEWRFRNWRFGYDIHHEDVGPWAVRCFTLDLGPLRICRYTI